MFSLGVSTSKIRNKKFFKKCKWWLNKNLYHGCILYRKALRSVSKLLDLFKLTKPNGRTQWDHWNAPIRAGPFQPLYQLNKGPLCCLKICLYSFSPTPFSHTHPWSMTVTRSLGKSESFLGSAKSLVACTSTGLACKK